MNIQFRFFIPHSLENIIIYCFYPGVIFFSFCCLVFFFFFKCNNEVNTYYGILSSGYTLGNNRLLNEFIIDQLLDVFLLLIAINI